MQKYVCIAEISAKVADGCFLCYPVEPGS